MYENVLVPFDFSDDSRYAVDCLRRLPGLRRVVLLHVVFSRRINPAGVRSDTVTDYARLRLGEFRQSLQWEEAQVQTRVERVLGGPFSEVVDRVASEEGISLVAMGRRGRGIVETLLVGSFAADILQNGRQDVLIVHAPADRENPGPEMGGGYSGLFSNVLICTDFSVPEIAADCAAALPREAALTLFHTVETGESQEEVREISSAAQTRLEELARRISPGRGPVRVDLRVGDPADEIVRVAREKAVSLIVVKSRGDRGLIHTHLGRTSSAVVRMADRPILVVKRSEPGISPAEGSLAGSNNPGA